MLDIRSVRAHAQEYEEALRSKDASVDLGPLLAVDQKRSALTQKADELKAQRNEQARLVGMAKQQGEEIAPLLQKGEKLAEEIHLLDRELNEVEREFHHLLSLLPNLPMEEVPRSPHPEENVVVKEWGTKPTFSFSPKHHLELNELHHLFDLTRGAKLAGSGWPVYRGMGARLEWALLQYMLDTHIKNGYEPWILPLCVREEMMFGSGQLPKFADQHFRIEDPDYPLSLIPTGEVPLNGLLTGEIVDGAELPLRYLTYTPCFRREAGAAGKKERGLIRVHQFNKVELYCFTKPEQSPAIHEEMVASAEGIVEGLGLHYRRMLLVTGDTSFSSAKTIDIEVYLPGQERYYEVSSVSNCTDFQARRSHIRFREEGGKPTFLHTLNGSGVATSRLMVALLENFQRADGSIALPEVLHPYLGGIKELSPVNLSP